MFSSFFLFILAIDSLSFLFPIFSPTRSRLSSQSDHLYPCHSEDFEYHSIIKYTDPKLITFLWKKVKCEISSAVFVHSFSPGADSKITFPALESERIISGSRAGYFFIFLKHIRKKWINNNPLVKEIVSLCTTDYLSECTKRHVQWNYTFYIDNKNKLSHQAWIFLK